MGDIGSPEADMLIGADFFLSHRVYVASSQRKLYFTYNGGPVFDLRSAPASMTASTPPESGADANDSPAAANGSAAGGPAAAAPTTTSAEAPTTVASAGLPATASTTSIPATASVPEPATDAAPIDSSEPGSEPAPPPAAAPPPPIPAGEPTDAAGFARRGTAFAARRDFPRAIADLTRACELAPSEANYFYLRGRTHLANRQPILAMDDFSQALKLKPDHVQALMSRAALRLSQGGDVAGATGAIVDLDKVDATVAKEADIRLDLGNLYARAEAYKPAIAQFDLWLKQHRGDVRVADASGSRCRAKGMLGQDLDEALSDCNRAVKARAGAPFLLDSRALVYLRLGNFDKSIEDYDSVLSKQPKNPWALYCRGLAKVRKGMTAEGQADIAASRAIAPRAAQQAARHGLVP